MKKTYLTLALLGLSSLSPVFAKEPPVGGHLIAMARPEFKNSAKPESKPESKPQPFSPVKSAEVEKGTVGEKSLFMRTLPSTCWLRSVPDENGNYIYGSGLILDVDRHLVITTAGVMTNYDKLICDLPAFDGDDVVVEPSEYYKNNSPAFGTVLYRDPARNLAILHVDKLPAGARAVKFASSSAQPGEAVLSIAAKAQGSEGMWIMSQGHVRMTYQRTVSGGAKCRTVESDLPCNQGCAGGPLVNQRGELVGVMDSFEQSARLVSKSIEVGELKTFLKDCERFIEPQEADDFNDRGVAKYDCGRYDAAMEDYSQALQLNPDHAEAHNNMGWVFHIREDYETAIAEFDQALKLQPELATAYHGRGESKAALGRNADALKDMTQAIRRLPQDADLYVSRGKLHKMLKNMPLALTDLTRAVNLSSSSDNLFYRGQLLGEMRRYEEAQKDLAFSLKANPSNHAAWLEVGSLFYKQQKYADAVIMFSGALNIFPKDDNLLNWRGCSYYAQKDYQRAIIDYGAAIEINSNNAQYFSNAADAMWGMGKLQEAVNLYNKCLELDPNHQEAAKRRDEVAAAIKAR